MMSMLQQRQLIEASFVPYICKCTISSDGVVSIRVSDPKTEVVLLDLTGIPGSQLMSWNSISAFVEGLQRDLDKFGATVESKGRRAPASDDAESS